MGRRPHYSITTASIADYLRDIEHRWGIKLQFTITHDPDPYSQDALIVELFCKFDIHQREVPQFIPSTKWLLHSDGTKFLFDMWDMLLDADKEMAGGLTLP